MHDFLLLERDSFFDPQDSTHQPKPSYSTCTQVEIKPQHHNMKGSSSLLKVGIPMPQPFGIKHPPLQTRLLTHCHWVGFNLYLCFLLIYSILNVFFKTCTLHTLTTHPYLSFSCHVAHPIALHRLLWGDKLLHMLAFTSLNLCFNRNHTTM